MRDRESLIGLGGPEGLFVSLRIGRILRHEGIGLVPRDRD